jgi:hypothetical protein
MVRIDLTTVEGRLAVAERIFCYPMEPHRRKHGPTGYTVYESYRDWLRDEFSFRCVFSLIREQWIDRTANFDIDHILPQVERPDLTCEYENLLYLSHRANLIRNKHSVTNPCEIALGKVLRVVVSGERMGEIEGLDPLGDRIIKVLRLNSDDSTRYRRLQIGIARSLAKTDEDRFRELVGFPLELPDLRKPKRRVSGNTRPGGLDDSYLARRERNELPEWY